MSEKAYLEYIRETGAEIKELNEKVQSLQDELSTQKVLNERLNGELKVKMEQIERMSDVANNWYNEYARVNRDKNDFEQRLTILTNALEVLAPKLKEAIDKELEEDELFSELLSNTKSKNRYCYF